MKRISIFILAFTPLIGTASYSDHLKEISVYGGSSYRYGHTIYNSFDLMYENYNSTCTNTTYKGFGLRYDNYRNNGEAYSVKFFHGIGRFRFPMPYLALSPVVYTNAHQSAFLLKPEVGIMFKFQPIRDSQWGLNMYASYGYDIPLINSETFILQRSEICLKLGLSYNLY
ncbi:MAG: hypothetical protein V4613_04005 [Bacteroidota bacterium]